MDRSLLPWAVRGFAFALARLLVARQEILDLCGLAALAQAVWLHRGSHHHPNRIEGEMLEDLVGPVVSDIQLQAPRDGGQVLLGCLQGMEAYHQLGTQEQFQDLLQLLAHQLGTDRRFLVQDQFLGVRIPPVIWETAILQDQSLLE